MRYPLRQPLRCVLLARSLNDSYLVEASEGRFVLRVYRAGWRTDAEVAYEVALLRHLDAAGIRVTAPIPTRSGEFVWTVSAPEGPRPAVLFTYAAGGRPGDPYPGGAYGRALAELHAALDDFTSPAPRSGLDWTHLVEEPLTAIRSFVGRRDVSEYVERVAAALHRRIDELDRAGLDTGACHGDPHGFNVHVGPDGGFTFLDFDSCGPGWRAYDLAVFRWWHRAHRKPEAVWLDFLAGYAARRAPSEADLAAVPLLVAVRHIVLLGTAVGNVDHFGNRWWLDDAFFDTRLKALADWLDEHTAATPSVSWTCSLVPTWL